MHALAGVRPAVSAVICPHVQPSRASCVEVQVLVGARSSVRWILFMPLPLIGIVVLATPSSFSGRSSPTWSVQLGDEWAEISKDTAGPIR